MIVLSFSCLSGLDLVICQSWQRNPWSWFFKDYSTCMFTSNLAHAGRDPSISESNLTTESSDTSWDPWLFFFPGHQAFPNETKQTVVLTAFATVFATFFKKVVVSCHIVANMDFLLALRESPVISSASLISSSRLLKIKKCHYWFLLRKLEMFWMVLKILTLPHSPSPLASSYDFHFWLMNPINFIQKHPEPPCIKKRLREVSAP